MIEVAGGRSCVCMMRFWCGVRVFVRVNEYHLCLGKVDLMPVIHKTKINSHATEMWTQCDNSINNTRNDVAQSIVARVAEKRSVIEIWSKSE